MLAYSNEIWSNIGFTVLTTGYSESNSACMDANYTWAGCGKIVITVKWSQHKLMLENCWRTAFCWVKFLPVIQPPELRLTWREARFFCHLRKTETICSDEIKMLFYDQKVISKALVRQKKAVNLFLFLFEQPFNCQFKKAHELPGIWGTCCHHIDILLSVWSAYLTYITDKTAFQQSLHIGEK